MIVVIEYIIHLCNNLIYLLADERLEAYLGAPLIWILIAFFIIWVVANIYIIRPIIGGSLVSGILHYKREEVHPVEKYHDDKFGWRHD